MDSSVQDRRNTDDGEGAQTNEVRGPPDRACQPKAKHGSGQADHEDRRRECGEPNRFLWQRQKKVGGEEREKAERDESDTKSQHQVGAQAFRFVFRLGASQDPNRNAAEERDPRARSGVEWVWGTHTRRRVH